MTAPKSSVVRVTIAAAIDAVTVAAFDVPDPESPDRGRALVHCFAGSGGPYLGAYWDLSSVVATIKDSRDVGWLLDLPSALGHELGVVSGDGRIYRFEVEAPDGLEVPDAAGRLRGAIEILRDVAGPDDLNWRTLGERANLLVEAASEWIASRDATPVAPEIEKLRDAVRWYRNTIRRDTPAIGAVAAAARRVADHAGTALAAHPSPGDTVIDLRDGVPHVSTTPKE